jgi:hypothetical protein
MNVLKDLLAANVSTALQRFRGLQLKGTIPVPARIINELAREVERVPRDLRIEIEDSNRIVARFGVLRVTAVLADALQLGGSPRITLQLASAVVAWTLRRVLRIPEVTFDGRLVTIDLGRAPALQPYRELLSHVRSVSLTTSPGVLHVRFEVVVAERAAAVTT